MCSNKYIYNQKRRVCTFSSLTYTSYIFHFVDKPTYITTYHMLYKKNHQIFKTIRKRGHHFLSCIMDSLATRINPRKVIRRTKMTEKQHSVPVQQKMKDYLAFLAPWKSIVGFITFLHFIYNKVWNSSTIVLVTSVTLLYIKSASAEVQL